MSDTQFEASHRLDTELGYGLAGPGGFGTLTPYIGLSLSDGAARTLKGGARWKTSQSATVPIRTVERWEQGRSSPPESATALILMAQKYPDTFDRLASL